MKYKVVVEATIYVDVPDEIEDKESYAEQVGGDLIVVPHYAKEHTTLDWVSTQCEEEGEAK